MLLAALAALLPVAALAHASLLTFDLSGPRLTLVFSEPVQPVGDAVRVYGRSGRIGGVHVSHPQPALLVADFDTAPPGDSVVFWQVISSDTHPARGSFSLSGASPSSADVGGVAPLGLLSQTISRFVHFLGLALGFGVPLVVLLTGAWGLVRWRRLALAGALLIGLAELFWLFGQAASLGAWDQQSLADIVASPAGRVLGLRLGAALGLWALLGIEGRERPVAIAAAVIGVAVCLVDSSSAHALRGWPVLVQVALTSLHEGSMAVWVGGFLAVLFGVIGARGFSVSGVVSVGVSVLSGGVLALLHIPSLAALYVSLYGEALLLKLLSVALALVVGYLSFRAGRARRLELAALSAVLAAAGLLISLPPPR